MNTVERIEYREDGKTVCAMACVPGTVDDAKRIAQKYMNQFASIETAHILTDEKEIVVSRATEWQKRN